MPSIVYALFIFRKYLRIPDHHLKKEYIVGIKGVLESWRVLKYYEKLSLNSLSWFNMPKEGELLYDIDLDTKEWTRRRTRRDCHQFK